MEIKSQPNNKQDAIKDMLGLQIDSIGVASGNHVHPDITPALMQQNPFVFMLHQAKIRDIQKKN